MTKEQGGSMQGGLLTDQRMQKKNNGRKKERVEMVEVVQ